MPDSGLLERYALYNNVLTLRNGGLVQEESVPWVAEDLQCYSLT